MIKPALRPWLRNSLIIIAVLIVISAFPLITQFLAWWELDIAVGGGVAWIGYFGGYFGAIIGGVISGYVTFQAVRYTINNDRKKEFMDSLPRDILVVEDIIYFIRRERTSLKHSLEQDKGHLQIRGVLMAILRQIKENDYLSKSASVDLDAYRAVRNIYDELVTFFNPGKGTVAVISSEDMLTLISKTIDSLEYQHSELIEEYRKYS